MKSLAVKLDKAVSRESDGEQLIATAIAVLEERIKMLPEADSAELFDLLAELPRAADVEEKECLWIAIREVLAQKPMNARPLPPRVRAPKGRAQHWAQAVGQRVRTLRTAASWTQTQLAEKAGLPQSHVCRIEKAEYTATNKTLSKLAKALGVELAALDPNSET